MLSCFNQPLIILVGGFGKQAGANIRCDSLDSMFLSEHNCGLIIVAEAAIYNLQTTLYHINPWDKEVESTDGIELLLSCAP